MTRRPGRMDHGARERGRPRRHAHGTHRQPQRVPPSLRQARSVRPHGLLANASPAFASCGSAFCTLMTDRYAQGTGIPHNGWSLDARLESIVQDQLRQGDDDLDASEVTGEDEIERRTENETSSRP